MMMHEDPNVRVSRNRLECLVSTGLALGDASRSGSTLPEVAGGLVDEVDCMRRMMMMIIMMMIMVQMIYELSDDLLSLPRARASLSEAELDISI